jgi:hypothetical protein
MPTVEDQDQGKKDPNSDLIKELSKKVAMLEKQKDVAQSTQVVQAPAQGDSELKQLVSLLAKQLNAPTDDKPISNFQGYTAFEDIDESDMLPENEQKTFVAYSVHYPIVDGIINNKPVKAPYGVIEFKYQGTKKVGSGKGREENVFNFCAYHCKSRKVLDFLLKHHLYNVTFFDNLTSFGSKEVTLASKIASNMSALNTIGAVELMGMAKHHGLQTTSDLSAMRASIATHLASKEFESERVNQEQRIRNIEIEESLIQK